MGGPAERRGWSYAAEAASVKQPSPGRRARVATTKLVIIIREIQKTGAQGRNRTTDTVIFSHVLYQLSYLGACAVATGGRLWRPRRALSSARGSRESERRPSREPVGRGRSR